MDFDKSIDMDKLLDDLDQKLQLINGAQWFTPLPKHSSDLIEFKIIVHELYNSPTIEQVLFQKVNRYPDVNIERYRNKKLVELFNFVDPDFYRVASRTLQDFLVEAIEYHEIDTSRWCLIGTRGMMPCVLIAEKYLNLYESGPETEADIRWMVLHELAHVIQVNARRLVADEYSDRIFFDGIETNTNYKCYTTEDYNRLPHELEANVFALQSKLYKPCPVNYMTCLHAAREELEIRYRLEYELTEGIDREFEKEFLNGTV